MVLSPSISLFDEQQVVHAAAGALAWMTWDALIHLDIEVERIWQRPRSWVKALYFSVRYLPIFHQLAVTTALSGIFTWSPTACKGWVYYQLIFVQVVTALVEVILVLRLYVLYSRNRVVLAALVLAYTAEISMMAVVLGMTLPKLRFGDTCLLKGSPGIFMAFWLSSLVFETFLFVLTLIKFLQSVAHNIGKHSILFIFVRDGTWAFALIFVSQLFNMLMYKLAHSPFAGMGYAWALGVFSFSGSHVVLNLRGIGLPNPSHLETSGHGSTSDYSRTTRDDTHDDGAGWRTYFTSVFDPESFSSGDVEMK
ncbi:hypothetical protein BC835DRAFT_1339264 [Cytidiella melzeri]|nr:hypothetical protein BC835DRAFT_1339264 [Cytidiella melzeri]